MFFSVNQDLGLDSGFHHHKVASICSSNVLSKFLRCLKLLVKVIIMVKEKILRENVLCYGTAVICYTIRHICLDETSIGF